MLLSLTNQQFAHTRLNDNLLTYHMFHFAHVSSITELVILSRGDTLALEFPRRACATLVPSSDVYDTVPY